MWDLRSVTPLDVRYKSEILEIFLDFFENYPAPPTVVKTQGKKFF
jgi:ubiquitin-protein ligase